VLDRPSLTTEVKLASMATRSRLLREPRRCQQRGWSVPSARAVLRAPQEYELLLMCQRLLLSSTRARLHVDTRQVGGSGSSGSRLDLRGRGGNAILRSVANER
jgi:hypothetical protein